MTTAPSAAKYITDSAPGAITRAGFLRRVAAGSAALALASRGLSAAADTRAAAGAGVAPPATFDLREFVTWITTQLEPSVKLPGGAGRYARTPGDAAPELYGVADMACILYTIGALRPDERARSEWAAAFQEFQNPTTGWLVEKDPSHDPLHNTAFALASLQLLDLAPRYPVRMGTMYADPAAFLATLNWRKGMYPESHKGAGAASILALVPELNDPAWFRAYFAACDHYVDPHNGLLGVDKPAGGDSDQIGGSFHYFFLYEAFNRQMPFPEQRIDTVLRLQQPDGYWMPDNHLWMTLDAIYLMTRTLRYCPHRFEDVRAVVRRTLGILMRDVYSPEGRAKTFTGKLAVHSVTAAISIAAEAQNFLGAAEVITERPLRLVLDRRPFI